jgi:hypothetical protein
MVGKILATCLLMAFSIILGAQNLVVKTELSSKNPYLGEEFQITYKLQLDGSGTFSHSGRVQVKKSVSDNFKLINEGQPQRDVFSFGSGMSLADYALVLKPTKTGNLELPEFSFVLSGKEYKAKKQSITVSKGVDYSNRNESRDYFIELVFSSVEVYKGESITCSVKLFNKVNINRVDIAKADFSSFKVKELKADNSARKVNMGGRTYYMQEIAAYQLTPLKSGSIKTTPIEANVQMVQGRGFRRNVVNQKTNSLAYKIVVKDLPKPAPAGFVNAVGEFKMTSKVNQNEVEVNEAVNWDIVIEGKGNIDLLTDPEFSFDPDLESFDPKVERNISSNRSGTRGKVQYTYVLVPREAGSYELPEFAFTFFDPKQEKYITLKGDDLAINANAISDEGGDYHVEQKGVKVHNNDIRYIKSEQSIKSNRNKSVSWILFLSLMGASVLVYVVFNTKVIKASSQKGPTIKALMKKLEGLDDNDQLSAKLLVTLQEYFSLKWGVEASAFSKETRRQVYESQKISTELSNDLEEIIENLEISRYAGGGASLVYKEKLKNVLKNLES